MKKYYVLNLRLKCIVIVDREYARRQCGIDALNSDFYARIPAKIVNKFAERHNFQIVNREDLAFGLFEIRHNYSYERMKNLVEERNGYYWVKEDTL